MTVPETLKIGNTELIKIDSISNEIKRNVYFKAEYTNPGGSIKDRAVLFLLNDAIATGKIQPGGTLVEATAGNTGIALAFLANTYVPPFKVRLFVPETLVEEKLNILIDHGAEVVKCPLVKPDDPLYMNNQAKLYAAQNSNAFHINQFDNLQNRNSHFETTGPEIFQQTNGKIDAFICGCGTGGTFAGISEYLKSQNPEIKTFCSDNEGSGLYTFLTTDGKSWEPQGTAFVEGIGRLGMCENMSDILKLSDGVIRITNLDVIITIYKLIHDDGFRVGGSGGLNIAAARKLAETLPEGSIVVTTVADVADRYASKLFNKQWLTENGYFDKIPQDLQYLAK